MRTPGFHPLNVSYLVVGLVFLGLAGSWGLREAGVVDLAQVQWLLPLVLVVAGLVGLVAMIAKGVTRGRTDDTDAYSTYDTYGHGNEGEDR
jgi:hypothetical protein